MILLSMPGNPKEITVSKISEIKMPKTNRFLVRKICNNVSLSIFFFIVFYPGLIILPFFYIRIIPSAIQIFDIHSLHIQINSKYLSNYQMRNISFLQKNQDHYHLSQYSNRFLKVLQKAPHMNHTYYEKKPFLQFP